MKFLGFLGSDGPPPHSIAGYADWVAELQADLVEVLDTERSLFNAELAESQTLRLYFNSIIELYKALGGGWPCCPEDI